MKINVKPIVEFIVYDPIRKIVAIIFSFGLWFFVAIDNNYQYEKDIQIIYTNLPDSLILVDSVPSLRVVFSGRGGALLTTWAAPPKARCDLNKPKLGENTIPVKKLLIPVAFDDIALYYNTASIKVTVDRKKTKVVKINVPFKGSPKKGYSVSDIIVLDTVEITGPANILKNITAIPTETLSVKNTNSPFLTKLEIEKTASNIHVSQEEVRLEVRIEKTVEKLFTNIPLKLIFTPNQRVTSEKISLDTLIVQGPEKRINRLKKKDIIVKITLTKLSPGDYALPAAILLPEYIKPVYSNPKKFRIKIY